MRNIYGRLNLLLPEPNAHSMYIFITSKVILHVADVAGVPLYYYIDISIHPRFLQIHKIVEEKYLQYKIIQADQLRIGKD